MPAVRPVTPARWLQQTVTWGSCRRVRHPFSVAYLLLIYMAIMLNIVAAKEERKLSASKFGAEYQDYLTRTGLFVPSWSRPACREATS